MANIFLKNLKNELVDLNDQGRELMDSIMSNLKKLGI